MSEKEKNSEANERNRGTIYVGTATESTHVGRNRATYERERFVVWAVGLFAL